MAFVRLVMGIVAFFVAVWVLKIVLGIIGFVLSLLWAAIVIGFFVLIGYVIYKILTPRHTVHS